MKTEAYMYLHGDKSSNYEFLTELYFDFDEEIEKEYLDRALEKFLYALYEVEFKVEIDLETGEYKVLEVDIGNGQNKFYEGEKQ